MSPNPPQRLVSGRMIRILMIVFVFAAIVIVATGVVTRRVADASLSTWTQEQAVPAVAVAYPSTQPPKATLELPGRLEAYSQAQIYARVSGYLKEWTADIGTSVKAGQLLAVIDAPDLDQQIMQAQATLASAQANLKLSQATLARGKSLMQTGSVSKQDLDQRAADAANKEGLVNAAQAELDRLRVLEKYKRITAPFDGLVTARSTDVGALINAGAGGAAPLFVVSDVSKMRVYVNVPQSNAAEIRVGTKAQVRVPEFPDRHFVATVEASSQAVDAASGTVRTLLIVDNSAGQLMTGAFANVRFELTDPPDSVSVPASALIFDKDGLQVATVGTDDRVALKPVTISRDLGSVVELASGLGAADRIIVTPPDGVMSGDKVRIAGSQERRLTARER